MKSVTFRIPFVWSYTRKCSWYHGVGLAKTHGEHSSSLSILINIYNISQDTKRPCLWFPSIIPDWQNTNPGLLFYHVSSLYLFWKLLEFRATLDRCETLKIHDHQNQMIFLLHFYCCPLHFPQSLFQTSSEILTLLPLLISISAVVPSLQRK